MENAGKRFEKDWIESVPDDVYCLRLNDPAQAFGGNDATRFSPHNPYDFVMYKYPHYFALELKSTKGTSLTFWREDFGKGQYMIKKWQILGLLKASEHPGVVAGIIINFRGVNRTYFCEAESFYNYIGGLSKKSINEQDVIALGGIIINQKQLKVRWRYDMEGFIDVAAGQQQSDKDIGGADNPGGGFQTSADNCETE